LEKWRLAELGGHLNYDPKKNRYTYPSKGVFDILYNNYMPEEEYKQVDPFENYTLGYGKDNNGEYISMYDTYDFDSPVMEKISNPYDFYDRVYFKRDEYGKYKSTKPKDLKQSKKQLLKVLKNKQSGKANK
jgi:hypothetical protein